MLREEGPTLFEMGSFGSERQGINGTGIKNGDSLARRRRSQVFAVGERSGRNRATNRPVLLHVRRKFQNVVGDGNGNRLVGRGFHSG